MCELQGARPAAKSLKWSRIWPKRVFSFVVEGFPFEGRHSVLFAWYVDSALCCPSSVSSASNPEQ